MKLACDGTNSSFKSRNARSKDSSPAKLFCRVLRTCSASSSAAPGRAGRGGDRNNGHFAGMSLGFLGADDPDGNHAKIGVSISQRAATLRERSATLRRWWSVGRVQGTKGMPIWR